jgi:hypothetical protein
MEISALEIKACGSLVIINQLALVYTRKPQNFFVVGQILARILGQTVLRAATI